MTDCITVTTQAELDEALADASTTCVHINSPKGVWLSVATPFGSATVEAFGSATVRAFGSATVEAFGSATVRAFGSATVEAGSHVAVHLHSGRARIQGGVLIDHTAVDQTDAATWCAYHGVDVVDGRATLYKCADGELVAGHDHIPTSYAIGTEVAASDWADNNDCGGGLHLSPRPWQAASYQSSPLPRFLRCTVALADLRPIHGDKAKARACLVEAEVNDFGRELAVAEATS